MTRRGCATSSSTRQFRSGAFPFRGLALAAPGGPPTSGAIRELYNRGLGRGPAYTILLHTRGRMLLPRFLSAAFLLLIAGLQVATAKHPPFITPEVIQMVKADKERCMAEHGTTEDLIDQVNDGHLPDDRAITCYMYCLFEAFSLVDDDGELEVDMLVGFIPDDLKEVAHDLIEACAHEKGTDPCNKMYVMAKCVQTKRPDLWFML